MKKFLIVICLLIVGALNPVFKTLSAKEHHQHGEAYGLHGMALFSVGDTFYASHMPLANSIHAHQIIFSFSLDESHRKALEALEGEYKLVSFEPELFDLALLMNGKKTKITGKVYANHFERGGELKIEKVDILVRKLILSEQLTNQKNGLFYLIETDSNKGLLVHKIGKKPSYDRILEVSFKTPKQAQTAVETVDLSDFDSVFDKHSKGFSVEREIYLERQDFQ